MHNEIPSLKLISRSPSWHHHLSSSSAKTLFLITIWLYFLHRFLSYLGKHFGFFSENFSTTINVTYWGFFMIWKEILSAFGEKKILYRVSILRNWRICSEIASLISAALLNRNLTLFPSFIYSLRKVDFRLKLKLK